MTEPVILHIPSLGLLGLSCDGLVRNLGSQGNLSQNDLEVITLSVRKIARLQSNILGKCSLAAQCLGKRSLNKLLCCRGQKRFCTYDH